VLRIGRDMAGWWVGANEREEGYTNLVFGSSSRHVAHDRTANAMGRVRSWIRDEDAVDTLSHWCRSEGQ
jgi:hypothetical protein